MKLKKWDNKSIKVILFISIFILLSLGIAYASGAFLGGSNQASLTKGLVGHWKLDEESIIDFTINEYSYPTFDTSNSNGGWSHWGRSGAIGSYSQNTNKNYIFDKSNTYSHRVSNGPSATGEYLLYQSPSIEGITNRSLSAIVKLSDGSQVTNDKIFPAWNAITSGSIPNNIWTSIDYLGDGFYLCKAEGIKQDGSNDLVGIYVSPGIEAYFSIVQLEQKTYSSSFINGARNGTVDDRSGYSNKGINYGAILTNGIKGESKGALSFDGINDYIEYDDDNNLFNSLPISFSIWFYQDGTRSGDLINKYYSSSVNGYSITLSPTGGIRLYYFKDASNYIESYNGYYGQPILNSWNHVVVNVDENNAKIYLNNNLVVTKNWVGTSGKPTTNQKLSLGRYPGSTNVYSNNIISDVRIYNRVLSEEEIKLLYDSYNPQITSGHLNKGLIAHYPLNEEYETKDITTNVNHVINENPTFTINRKDVIGEAMDLIDSTGTNFIKPIDIGLNLNDESISFWMKCDFPRQDSTGGSFSNWIIQWGNYYNSNSGGFGLQSGNLMYFIKGSTNSGWSTSGTLGTLANSIYDEGDWVYYTLVFEGDNKIKFYMNGNEIRVATINDAFTGYSHNNLNFGKDMWAYLDDVRIYDKVLSKEEIKLLYDSYNPQTTVASLNKGLVLDMPLTSTWTKSETPGSEIITDKTPYSNNGQNYGTVLSGEGATFDGSNDYIVTGWGQGLNPSTNPLTITMWVKPNNVNSATMFFSNRQSGGSSNRLYISIYNGKWDLGIHTTTWGSGTINANTDWNFISVVMDGSQATMKANLQTTRTISYGSYNLNLNAHLGTHDLNYWYNGLIKNVRIYNRALSDEEIKLLYDQGKT